MALDVNSKIFVVHVAIRKRKKILVYSKKQAQVGALLFDKAFTEVPAKYSNYSNVFLVENITKLPENTRMNKHVIELEEDKELLFDLIYSLELIKLETLKTYIETNLANGFIQLFKSPARILIFFDKKSDESLHLYVDYRSLNNINIKNQYLLSLIGELLDWLGRARRFT